MENQNIKAIEVLSNAMQNMIDKKVNNIARDRTRIGMVKTVNLDGTFKVLIDGREYDKVQAYGDGDIVANELVKIVYPDNNPTNMFILPKPSRRLATTNYSGWISAQDKIKIDSYPSAGTNNDRKVLRVNSSDIIEYIDLGTVFKDAPTQLTSTTLDGLDLVGISDASNNGVLSKLTIDSLFAFLKLRTNYTSINIISSTVLSEIKDYLTIDSNYTINTLRIDRFGFMVNLYMSVTRDVALGVGNITNDTIAILKDSSLFPSIITSWSTASIGDIVVGYVGNDGYIVASATQNGGSSFNFGVTYMI